MLVKVLGKQKLDYINKQNKPVKGTTLHVVSPFESDGHEGNCVDKYFINVNNKKLHDKMSEIKVESEINILFNKYGSIEDIEVL